MKSSRFWVFMILSWLIIAALCARVFQTNELPLFAFLSIYWLYGIFNLGVFITSHIIKTETPLRLMNLTCPPRITVLYSCFNDFNVKAATSLLELDYPHFEIIILDDSSDKLVMDEVDLFATTHQLKVIRRMNRKGWKAGAINNVVGSLKSDYVILSDSDELLPSDFIQKILTYFKYPDTIFVQANHRCYHDTDDHWSRLMGRGIDLHWNHYQEYRNKYGLVQILGHGVMIKSDVLKKYNFPEVVSEDLAMTLILAQGSMRGLFAKDVVCGEAFPSNYNAFRKRHKKWCQGAAQLVRYFINPFLASKNVKLLEKVDAVIATYNLPLMLTLPVFIIFSALMKPSAYSDPIVLTISIITILSPLLIFTKMEGTPINKLKSVLLNTIAYGSLCALSIIYLLKGFIRPTFNVTNIRSSRIFDKTILFDLALGLTLNVFAFPNLLGITLLMSPILWLKYR